MASYKNVSRESTVGAAVADAIETLHGLGEECQEVYDAIPEAAQGSDRAQSFENSATDVEALRDGLQSAVDDAEGCEFPGMYG